VVCLRVKDSLVLYLLKNSIYLIIYFHRLFLFADSFTESGSSSVCVRGIIEVLCGYERVW